MVRKKELHSKTLFLAFVITTIIFIAGIMVGSSLSQKKVEILEEELSSVNRDLETIQLESLMLKTLGENITCPLLRLRLFDVNKQSYELGSNLEKYGQEKQLDESYYKLANKYTRTLITYWLLARELNQACGQQDFITILYFFSSECADCDSQSFVLTYFKSRLEDKILNFALNTDNYEPSMDIIEEYYNITEYPSLVIENDKYEGLKDKGELEDIICTYLDNISFC